LSAFLADKDVRTIDVRATGEIEANERDFARAIGCDLAGIQEQWAQITRQGGSRLAPVV